MSNHDIEQYLSKLDPATLTSRFLKTRDGMESIQALLECPSIQDAIERISQQDNKAYEFTLLLKAQLSEFKEANKQIELKKEESSPSYNRLASTTSRL